MRGKGSKNKISESAINDVMDMLGLVGKDG